MTAGELIEALKKLDPTLEVWIKDSSGEYDDAPMGDVVEAGDREGKRVVYLE